MKRGVTRAAADEDRGRTRTRRLSHVSARPFPWRRGLRALAVVAACLSAGGLLGGGAKAAWTWLSTSPRFAIRQVAVRTGPRVTEAEIRMLANLKEGDNIFSFRLAETVAELEIHPWVKRAAVMRELPDRVSIEVVERRARAVIALGSLYYVDDDGEVFKKVLAGESLDLPVFAGISLRAVVEKTPAAAGLIRQGLEIVTLAERSRILPADELSEVRLDTTYGAVAVRATDGMRIRFGTGNYPDKWMRLERTLVELGTDAGKVAELDLNYESRVTVRLRTGYRLASAEPAAPAGN